MSSYRTPEAYAREVLTVVGRMTLEQWLAMHTEPPGWYTITHIGRVMRIWAAIVARFGASVPLPVAHVADDAIQFAWTFNQCHVNVDIYKDRWDWFFRDRVSGDCDFGESTDDALPDAFIARFTRLL